MWWADDEDIQREVGEVIYAPSPCNLVSSWVLAHFLTVMLYGTCIVPAVLVFLPDSSDSALSHPNRPLQNHIYLQSAELNFDSTAQQHKFVFDSFTFESNFKRFPGPIISSDYLARSCCLSRSFWVLSPDYICFFSLFHATRKFDVSSLCLPWH